MKYTVDIRTFAQILLFTLAPCTEISASEIPLNGTQMYSSGGLSTASHQTVHTIQPWHKMLNSGSIVSTAEKSHELHGSQPSTQVDTKSIKFTEQIRSVLDPTGLEHLEQCATYLNQDDMGIKNVKFKNDLLQALDRHSEIEFKVQRPSKNACKELFTLILN
jgi:hypothetical protein